MRLENVDETCCHSSDSIQLSTRQRPHLTSSTCTVPTDRLSPIMSPWHDGFESKEYLPTSRKVRVSDATLITRACQASVISRKTRLLRVPSVMWDCKDIAGFAMLSRRMGDKGEDFEVLTTGEVACDPRDIEPLLRSRTESEYNVVARDFFGDQFIFGSIVHEVQPHSFNPDLDDENECIRLKQEDFNVSAGDHATVRTASFAHSRRFARNEEWCFLDHYRPRTMTPASLFTTNGSTESSTLSAAYVDESMGFTIVLSSMPESELTAGKMKKQRVTQLHGITASYQVEPVPETEACAGPRSRVSFHATFSAPKSVPEGYADSETVRTRLMAIARSLHRLPDLLLLRQRQANQSIVQGSLSSRSGIEYRENEEANISRCVACTKRLRLKVLDTPTRRSKRCQICMYRACASCWSKENVETFSGHTTSVVVCRRCFENFGNSDYSHIQLT
uniref:FYVE-type domain-containing protein n=1 Tax=Hyaloperonospora arabidopsidis (strain Emoy2) TaxID=559515 RepID=M4B9H9_HYAAE